MIRLSPGMRHVIDQKKRPGLTRERTAAPSAKCTPLALLLPLVSGCSEPASIASMLDVFKRPVARDCGPAAGGVVRFESS